MACILASSLRLPTEHTYKQIQIYTRAQLAERLQNTTNPYFLGRCISENCMKTVGVHVLYPQTSSQSPLSPNSIAYRRYLGNLYAFFENLDSIAWMNTVLIVEGMQALSETKRFVSRFYGNPIYLITSDGIISNPYDYLDSCISDLRFYAQRNLPAYEKMLQIAKSDIVFEFGMFLGSCMQRAKKSLLHIAGSENIPEPQIVENKLLYIE